MLTHREFLDSPDNSEDRLIGGPCIKYIGIREYPSDELRRRLSLLVEEIFDKGNIDQIVITPPEDLARYRCRPNKRYA